LTKDRYNAGVASGGDVALAQTQLDTTRAQLIDLGVARAQYEHAIAILAGKPPAAVTVPAALLKTPPPAGAGGSAVRSAGTPPRYRRRGAHHGFRQ
jgi:outer membrane protein TolC